MVKGSENNKNIKNKDKYYQKQILLRIFGQSGECIVKLFLELIEKRFKDNNKLNRITNKNNCKISYALCPT